MNERNKNDHNRNGKPTQTRTPQIGHSETRTPKTQINAPPRRATIRKRKEKLEQARKEIAEGKSTTLEELIKELGWNRLFQIIVSQRAKKSIKKLPAHYEKRVIELLLLFRENPIPAEYYDIKKLKGYTDTYRARIGTIRIIYEALWNKRQIHILVVEPREKAYT